MFDTKRLLDGERIKWKEDVVKWFNQNSSNDYPQKLITFPPCDYYDKNIMEFDLINEWFVGDHCMKYYKDNQKIDLENVEFMKLQFKDKVKRVHNTFKEYVIYRMMGDLKLNFDDVPFFFISGMSDIRIFNTNILSPTGKRLDK